MQLPKVKSHAWRDAVERLGFLISLNTLLTAPTTSKTASRGDEGAEAACGAQGPVEGICRSSTGLGNPISQSDSLMIGGRPSSRDKSLC